MKLAFVYDAVYPWEKGGAQKRVWELARRLAERHDVHLFGMHYWDGPRVIEREGVTFHGVCEPRELYVEGRRAIPQALWFAAAVTPELLRHDFDIVDCQEFPYFPCFSAKLHELLGRSTLVVTWYEVWDDYWLEYLGHKGHIGRLVERLTVKLPTEIIAISEYIEADLSRLNRSSGISVVPNGVDYYGIQEIERHEDDCDIIYVGRLSEHKNVDVLLETVRLVADRIETSVTCKIIGDGPERESLEAYAQQQGLADEVNFLGFVEADEDVIAHLKTADVFVLPSTREGFPNTILEANACGVPSIVIDHENNGGRAVVEHGETGFITDLSPEEIAQYTTEILSDRELREQLQRGAREYGKQHDWSNVSEQLEDVYLNIVDP